MPAVGLSGPEQFEAEARRLIVKEGVSVVFGCWTSASRRAARPAFEELDHLLFYPVRHEGLELSPNIVYLGPGPNQQLIPAVRWAFTELGRRYFHVGSELVFPRMADLIMGDEIRRLKGELVGQAFRPIDATDFDGVVDQIRQTRPDVILNTINGESNVAFYRALRAAESETGRIPSVCLSIAEPEVRRLGLSTLARDYAVGAYFMSIDSPRNAEFVRRFRAKYGPQEVAGDPAEASYIGVLLWAMAARNARSVEPKVVRRHVGGLTLDAPEGPVLVDPTTQYLARTTRIAQVAEDGRFQIIATNEQNPAGAVPAVEAPGGVGGRVESPARPMGRLGIADGEAPGDDPRRIARVILYLSDEGGSPGVRSPLMAEGRHRCGAVRGPAASSSGIADRERTAAEPASGGHRRSGPRVVGADPGRRRIGRASG